MDRFTFKGLVSEARAADARVPLSRWYEACARAAGLRDWNELSALLPRMSDDEGRALVARAALQLTGGEGSGTTSGALTIVTNPNVHADIGESRQAFLKRVRHVRYGRTNSTYGAEEFLTTYIHSPETYAAWSAARDLIRNGDFRHWNERFKVRHFAIAIAQPLAQWIANNEPDLLIRQMALWLAAKDALHPDREGIMKEQLYPQYFQLVSELKRRHFPSPLDLDAQDEEIIGRYAAACRAEYGSSPPIVLAYPLYLGWRHMKAWGVKDRTAFAEDSFDFTAQRLFLNHGDWEHTVLGDAEDDMRRTESDDGSLWSAWVHQFANYERTRHHIYRPLVQTTTPARGVVYLLEQIGSQLYKIGFTTEDVERRVTSLQTGNGQRLKVVGSFACSGRSTEQSLHRRFAERRQLGEWFALTPVDVQNILDERWRVTESIF